MQEFPDSRIKYIEMPNQFKGRANDISITCKQHYRTCQQLAQRLAKENPKNQQEFEKIEYYKDFVVKTSQLNDQVLGLLDYIHDLLNEIAADSTLLDDAVMKDTLRLQSETIELLTSKRDNVTYELFESRRNQINAKQS